MPHFLLFWLILPPTSNSNNSEVSPDDGDEEESSSPTVPTDMDELRWGDTDTTSALSNSSPTDEVTLRTNCIMELDRYLIAKGQPLRGRDGKYSDPLVMWAANEHHYPMLANLTKAFLSIPATSALSERIWSRTANVLTIP